MVSDLKREKRKLAEKRVKDLAEAVKAANAPPRMDINRSVLIYDETRETEGLNLTEIMDWVLVKAVPLLAFAPEDYRSRLSTSLQGLWDQYEANDRRAFFDAAGSLDMAMDGRPTWDEKTEERIWSLKDEIVRTQQARLRA